MLISDYLNMDDTNHEIIICNHDNWRISGHIWIYLDMIMIIHDDHNLNNLSQRNMRIMYFTITHPGVRRRSQAFAGVRRRSQDPHSWVTPQATPRVRRASVENWAPPIWITGKKQANKVEKSQISDDIVISPIILMKHSLKHLENAAKDQPKWRPKIIRSKWFVRGNFRPRKELVAPLPQWLSPRCNLTCSEVRWKHMSSQWIKKSQEDRRVGQPENMDET